MGKLSKVFVASFVFALPSLAKADSRAPAPSPPVSLRALPAAKLDALPDAASVELDGRILTKKQFLEEMERKHAAWKGRTSFGSRAPESFDAFRTRIMSGHNRRIEASNQNVRAKAASILGGTAGIAPTRTPDVCTQPKIDAVSAAPPLAAGEELIINGCGFGAQAGEIRLVGGFPPKGYVTLALLKPWSGYALSANVPAVSGAEPQSAKLQVVTKDLRISNAISIGFEPTPGFALLTAGDVSVKVAAAGQDTCGPSNWSNGWTVGCIHYNSNSYFVGADTVSVDLKHHWTIDGYGAEWYGQNATLDLQGYAEQVAKESLTFHLQMWSKGIVKYRWNLYATGPLGVPMH